MITILLAFIFAIAFKICHLTERYLQEKGISPQQTFALYRYALIPAVIWSLIFIRPDDLVQLSHKTPLVIFLAIIAVTWNIQVYLTSRLINSVNSLSAFSTLQQIIYLPLLLAIGTYFNNDSPTIYSLLAILTLIAAFIVEPTPHQNNVRAKFYFPLTIIIGVLLFQSGLDAINQGMYRELLKSVRPEVVIGVFSVLTLSVTTIWSVFLPKDTKSENLLRLRWRRAALVPALWFIGTVPEAFVYAKISIYVGGVLMAVTFIMDAISDVIHQRIRLGARTFLFIILVLIGVSLAIFSVA
jgi:hypothetical protein